MRRLICLMIVSAVTTTLFACSGNDNGLLFIPGNGGTVTPAVTLTSIAVTPTGPSIGVGATQQFTATGTYSDSSTKDLTASVTWDSSNKSVATINSAGLATSVAAGTTTITATSGSIPGNTTLTVVTSGSTNGTLDTTFNGTGKVTTAFGGQYDEDTAKSVAIQSDGKIVVAGYTHTGSNYVFALARYNTNGTLDTTFNGTGKVTTAFGTAGDQAMSVAIQSDGRIVAAGTSRNGTGFYDFALARYNSNGTLDTTFNGTGKVTTAFGAGNGMAFSVAIRPADGKIVAAGYSDAGNFTFALARYNPDGSLDTSFDTDGKVTTTIGSSGDTAYSVAIQSDGKIVAAGYANNGGKYDFGLVRYNDDGSLDASFDTDGKVTTAFGSGSDTAYSIAIQSDGRIVAAGSSDANGSVDFALARYNPDGSLDTIFNGTGKVITAIVTTYDAANSVAIQSDGKIVAAGTANIGGNEFAFALARYNTNGTLDTSFGSGGLVTTSIGSNDAEANGVAIQPDGKIVAAGYSVNGFSRDFAVARYK